MTNLADAHARFKAALEQLGIEVGPEVLTMWLDRAAHDQEPLPAVSLRALAALVDELLAQGEREGNHDA